jgi:alpha-methylacyl-CoA racemase
MSANTGPLAGVKVLEFAGLGPAPHCAMLLADLGASVTTVERLGSQPRGAMRPRRFQGQLRGRQHRVALDLKSESGRDEARQLADRADVLLEGFRPRVMERLGLGPEVCCASNRRLVYARLTGWGQDGPWMMRAGHDINYLATSGLLNAIGRRGQPPTVPLNLLGDYGGGGMLGALGIVSALFERETSGLGQVVDAAMTDGIGLLGIALYGAAQAGDWCSERGTNLLDGGAPWYDVYETADARFIAVGALEENFYRAFVGALDLSLEELPDRTHKANWDALREVFAGRIKTRTFAEWCRVFADVDACVTPVLELAEAMHAPHAVARSSFLEIDGVLQPAPAPRFSRSPAALESG